jgi:hypothetical protein
MIDGVMQDPIEYIFEDDKRDVDSIQAADDSWSDGGTGVSWEIITAIQWDETTKQLQKKTRAITIDMGHLEIGKESAWTEITTAVACP